MVTFAVDGPRCGPPRGTAIRSTGGPSGSGAGGGVAGATTAVAGAAAAGATGNAALVRERAGPCADAQPPATIAVQNNIALLSFTPLTLSSRLTQARLSNERHRRPTKRNGNAQDNEDSEDHAWPSRATLRGGVDI